MGFIHPGLDVGWFEKCLKSLCRLELFNRVRIIAARDVGKRKKAIENTICRCLRIQVPKNDVQICLPFSAKAALWIQNIPKYHELIVKMRAYG